MSSDMIVQFQRKISECCESKVGHWKREIEKAKVASLLLNEVREKQVGNHEDDVMRVDIDFSEETIRKYDFFEPVAFQFCQEHINRFSDEQDIMTDRNFSVAPASISSRFFCPRPPLLLSNQNRHVTQARSRRVLFASDDPPLGFFGIWDFPYLKARDLGS